MLLHIIKPLKAATWGKQKNTLLATCKARMRPRLQYASSSWLPLASDTNIQKLQVTQKAALRTATGCTRDTNIQHLHDETQTLPLTEDFKLHASQIEQKNTTPMPPTSYVSKKKTAHQDKLYSITQTTQRTCLSLTTFLTLKLFFESLFIHLLL